MISCETAKPTEIAIDFEAFRPPLDADIAEPKTQIDLLNNWISTQSLLEQWQSYAMDFLEPLITSPN